MDGMIPPLSLLGIKLWTHISILPLLHKPRTNSSPFIQTLLYHPCLQITTRRIKSRCLWIIRISRGVVLWHNRSIYLVLLGLFYKHFHLPSFYCQRRRSSWFRQGGKRNTSRGYINIFICPVQHWKVEWCVYNKIFLTNHNKEKEGKYV